MAAPVRSVRVREAGGIPLSSDTRALLTARQAALSHRRRDDYKRINRECRAAIRSDTRSHYERQINQKGRSRFWQILRPIVGTKKSNSRTMTVTPDALNDYYISIGPVTVASVPAANTTLPVRLPRVNTGSFKVSPIDMSTLSSIVLGMKRSGSVGSDGLSVSILKKFFFSIGHILLSIINSSLISGIVPSVWKHALVTPVPKGASASRPEDTRPITQLPAILKITEKAVQLQLNDYIESNHLLSESQHGYRKNHSTETALSVITDKVLKGMDQREISILVLLDLSKCFDVVPHGKLLEKMNLYGIDTTWFSSYLRGHTQQVQVKTSHGSYIQSAKRSNTPGMSIFQGGSLSCILYLLFSNDLALFTEEDVTVVQYADDCQILVTGKKQDLPSLTNRMEKAFNSLHQWFCQNEMKLNAGKTQMMVLGTPQMLRTLPTVTIEFCGSTIVDSRVLKNL